MTYNLSWEFQVFTRVCKDICHMLFTHTHVCEHIHDISAKTNSDFFARFFWKYTLMKVLFIYKFLHILILHQIIDMYLIKIWLGRNMVQALFKIFFFSLGGGGGGGWIFCLTMFVHINEKEWLEVIYSHNQVKYNLKYPLILLRWFSQIQSCLF